MSLWRMIWQEIVHSKLNFLLGLLSVVIAIGTMVGALTLVRADQIRATDAGRELEDETRKTMKKLGFNIRILAKDEDLHAMNLTGVAQKTIHENNVTKLAESEIVTINHLLPVVTKRLAWEEQDGYEILLTGTKGEIPFAHRALKKPLQDLVPAGTMVVGHLVGEQLKLKAGQTVTFKGRDFKISKVQKPQGDLPDSTVWINLKEAQELLGMQNEVSAILALECNCATADRLAEIREDVAAILPGTQVIELGSQALARAEARNQAKKTADEKLAQHEDMATLLVPIALLGCGVWIGFSSLLNVRQRSAEIGILRAIGLKSRQILGLFMGKAVLLGIFGSVLGYALGFGVSVLWGDVSASLSKTQLFDQWLLIMALLLAPILAAVASWIPALTAARQDPAAILQGN